MTFTAGNVSGISRAGNSVSGRQLIPLVPSPAGTQDLPMNCLVTLRAWSRMLCRGLAAATLCFAIPSFADEASDRLTLAVDALTRLEGVDLNANPTLKERILKVLEKAGLVIARRKGREKLHFLNPVPIRLIHDRWIDKYTERRVSALANLKAELEKTA